MWSRFSNRFIQLWVLGVIGRAIATLSTKVYDEVMGPEPAPEGPQEIGQFVIQLALRMFGFFI